MPEATRRSAIALALALVVALGTSGCAAISAIGTLAIPDDEYTDEFADEEFVEEEYLGEGYESRIRIDEGATPFADIRVGDCLDDTDEMAIWYDSFFVEALSFDVVDCDEPHLSEVFGIVALTGAEFAGDESLGEGYPGDDWVYTESSTLCGPLFEPYIGASTTEMYRDLYYHYYGPGPESWDAGERGALCLVIDSRDRLRVGSAANSGL